MVDVRDAAVNFEAVKTSMSQSKQGTILRLALHPNEVPPSLHTDWVGSRYMVAMVKLGDDDQPEISTEQRDTGRLISSAGMLCRNVDFAHYIFEQFHRYVEQCQLHYSQTLLKQDKYHQTIDFLIPMDLLYQND